MPQIPRPPAPARQLASRRRHPAAVPLLPANRCLPRRPKPPLQPTHARYVAAASLHHRAGPRAQIWPAKPIRRRTLPIQGEELPELAPDPAPAPLPRQRAVPRRTLSRPRWPAPVVASFAAGEQLRRSPSPSPCGSSTGAPRHGHGCSRSAAAVDDLCSHAPEMEGSDRPQPVPAGSERLPALRPPLPSPLTAAALLPVRAQAHGEEDDAHRSPARPPRGPRPRPHGPADPPRAGSSPSPRVPKAFGV